MSAAEQMLTPETTYYWRVDAKNDHGAFRGNVWSFTTGTWPASQEECEGCPSVSISDFSVPEERPGEDLRGPLVSSTVYPVSVELSEPVESGERIEIHVRSEAGTAIETDGRVRTTPVNPHDYFQTRFTKYYRGDGVTTSINVVTISLLSG